VWAGIIHMETSDIRFIEFTLIVIMVSIIVVASCTSDFRKSERAQKFELCTLRAELYLPFA
jgi:hypothetical protein